MSKQHSEFEIPTRIKKRLMDKAWVKKQLEEGITVQKLFGFSDETIEKFYEAAFQLFEEKHYAEAANAFLFLVTLDPFHQEYWLGFGSAIQRCDDYEAAIDAYEMAAICKIDSPVPYFHLGKCLFAMHDRPSALQAIELALEYSDGVSEYDDLHHRALAAKALLWKEE